MDLLKSFAYPEELLALLRFKFGGCEVVMPKCDFTTMSPTLKQCFDLLNKTSRSFAAVIQALDGELRNAVCIFYLVLRALDTVEDDMTIPNDIKVPMLKSFYTNLLDPEWKYNESNDKDKIVLENFPSISREYRELSEIYREIISESCQKMGEGMTVFLEKKIDTITEWDEYCYYVAGLVGIGLAKLFSASRQEDKILGEDSSLANKVGLFLQKTNIIRDYLEDWTDQRIFWPKAAWSKYGSDLGDFAKPENQEKAVQCLNDLSQMLLSWYHHQSSL
uniref:Squalene synthase n=1 Tax=Arion vulgaris TaxID=1028688 RepID=A0A0B7A0C6_9EUPU